MEGIGYGQVIDGRHQLDDDIGWVMPFRETLPPGKTTAEIDQSHIAIKNIGPAALPHLKAMLLSQDSAVRDKIDRLLKPSAFLAKVFPSPQARRQHAMAAVHCMGGEAIPMLIQIFQDEAAPEDVRTFAAYTFLSFPKGSREALPSLELASGDRNPLLAYIATEAAKSVSNGFTDAERIEDQTN